MSGWVGGGRWATGDSSSAVLFSPAFGEPAISVSPSSDGRGGSEGGREDPSPWRSMGDASWLGAAGGGGPMAAAAADAEERAERFVGLLPGGGGRPLFVDILRWELGLDQKRKVVVRGQERWKLFKLLGHVFTTLIISKSFDCAIQLILSISFECFECSKGITLLPDSYN